MRSQAASAVSALDDASRAMGSERATKSGNPAASRQHSELPERGIPLNSHVLGASPVDADTTTELHLARNPIRILWYARTTGRQCPPGTAGRWPASRRQAFANNAGGPPALPATSVSGWCPVHGSPHSTSHGARGHSKENRGDRPLPTRGRCWTPAAWCAARRCSPAKSARTPRWRPCSRRLGRRSC